MKGIPWPLFVLLLLANGNFWRPKGFALQRRGPDDVGRARAARDAVKLALFVAGWVAAFVLLPAGWVALALLAYAAIAAPGIVEAAPRIPIRGALMQKSPYIYHGADVSYFSGQGAARAAAEEPLVPRGHAEHEGDRRQDGRRLHPRADDTRR